MDSGNTTLADPPGGRQYNEENNDRKENGKDGGKTQAAGGEGGRGAILAGFVWCKSGIVTKTRDPLVRLVSDSLKEQSIN